jgi:hypothetical protein
MCGPCTRYGVLVLSERGGRVSEREEMDCADFGVMCVSDVCVCGIQGGRVPRAF